MFSIVMLALTALAAFAQSPIDTTVVSDPATIVSPDNVNALTVALTVILSFLSGLIPGLKNIKSNLLRSIAVGIIVVIATVSFKVGWFNEAAFTVILTTIIPNFAYSGTVWEVLKFVLGLFKVELKDLRPDKGVKLISQDQ